MSNSRHFHRLGMANASVSDFHIFPFVNASLSLTLATTAIVANSFVLHVIRKAMLLDQPGAHLILVLALSDLLNAFSFLVSNIVRVVGWPFFVIICFQLNFLFTCATLCAVVINNFDCYRAIMQPMSYHVAQSRHRDLQVWGVAVFIITCLCAIPVAYPSDNQFGLFIGLQQYFRIFLLFLLALSFVCILGLYMRIFREMRWQQLSVVGIQACARYVSRTRLNRRFFRKLSIVSGAFLLSWFTFWILLLLTALRNHLTLKQPQCMEALLQFAFLLGQTNSIINPFLYARSPLIKNAFTTNMYNKKLCRIVCCFCALDTAFHRTGGAVIHRGQINRQRNFVENGTVGNSHIARQRCVLRVVHF